MLDFSAIKENKKRKAPSAIRRAGDHNLPKYPYEYNERSTGKRRKLTASMIDLKLRKPSKAKAKVKRRETDLFAEIEEDPDEPSTSGYFPPQECSSSGLESEDDLRSLQSTRLKRRRISNRDPSNDMPQKKKLFTFNRSPSSDNLSPQTPFTRGDGHLRKKPHQKLIAAKMNQDIKDVRIILDKSWVDEKMNQTGGTYAGQSSIQQSQHRQKDEISEAVIASGPDMEKSSVGDHDSDTDTQVEEEELAEGTESLVLFSDL